MNLKSKSMQRLGGGRLERWGIGFISWLQLLFLKSHKDPELLNLIRRIRKERRWLLLANEAFIVHALAKAQSRRPGDLAEVGVYEGGSARMICEAKGERRLFLFDTFAGLPPAGEVDGGIHREHQYACSRESVEAYLAAFPNVTCHEGLFPDSAEGVAELATAHFSFVHLDVDLYEGTRNCLEYFYSRMHPGGVILSHDYSILAGVHKAFSEFFADKPESVIELPTTQCMVVKLPIGVGKSG